MLREISNNDLALPGLLVTESADLPFMRGVKVQSYLIQRETDIVAIYNSPGLSQDKAAINDLGVPNALLMSHWHEAMYRAPTLDIPVYVHADDLSSARASMPKAKDMSAYASDAGGLEVIPTPSHTSGFSMFVWTCGGRRILFSGDAIWINGARWEAVVLGESSRSSYISSLEIIADLDFDVLIPWVYNEGEQPLEAYDRNVARTNVLAIRERIRHGENA